MSTLDALGNPSTVPGVTLLPPPGSSPSPAPAFAPAPAPAPAANASGVPGVSFLPAPSSSTTPTPNAPAPDENSPDNIAASLNALDSNDLLDDRRARILYQHEKQRSLGDKAAGYTGAALSGLAEIGKQGLQTAGELVTPGDWSRVPGSVLHGAVQGTAQTADLLRMLGRAAFDKVRDLGGTDDEKIAHFKERYNANLISQRALARGNTPDKTLVKLPDLLGKPLPGVTAFSSNFAEPITIATFGLGGAPEAMLKGAARKVLTAVPGGARALEVAGKAAALPGQAAKAALGTVETAGRAVKNIAAVPARWAEEKFGELGGVTGGVIGGAVAEHIPVAGKVFKLLAAAGVGGTALEQTAAFLRHLSETSGDHVRSRLLQMSLDKTAPPWMQVAAGKLDSLGVGKIAQFGADMAQSAGHGAVMGAAMGAVGGETPEQAGAMAGGGAGLGMLGRGARKVAGLDAKARQIMALVGARQRFAAYVLSPVEKGGLGMAPDAAAKIGDFSATVAGVAHDLMGNNAGFRFMDPAEAPALAEQYGQPGAKAWFGQDQQSGKPTIFVTAGDETGRFLHELPHAVARAVGADGEARLMIDSIFKPDQLAVMSREYAQRMVNGELKAKGQSVTDPEQYAQLIDQKVNQLNSAPDGNQWIYDEIYAEAGFGGLLQKDLVRIAQGDNAWQRLGNAARGKFFSDLGEFVDPKTGEPEVPRHALFTNPEVYNSPQLRRLFYEHLRNVYRHGASAEAGAKETKEGVPTGARVNMDLYGNHPAVPMTPNPATGRLENDAAVKDPKSGAVTLRKPAEVRRIERERQDNTRKVYEPLQRTPLAVDDPRPDVAPRRNTEGSVETTGTKITDQLSRMPWIGEEARKNAALAEGLMGTGGVFDTWYQAIGHGWKWYQDVKRRLGNIAAAKVKLAPFLFKVSKEGNALVVGLSVTAAQRKLARWQDAGKLDQQWGGDSGAFQRDLMRYLQNHAQGKDGGEGLNPEKKNLLNTFVLGYNKAFHHLNPLRDTLRGEEKAGIIRSLRLDRMASAEVAPETGWFTRYERLKYNQSPGASDRVLHSPEADESREDQDVWYSRLQKAIESVPAGNKEGKTGQQWKGWIARMSQGQALPTLGKSTWRGGIAKEEIDWSGMNDALKDGKRYTRDQVLDLLRQNAVQVNEVIHGGEPKWRFYGDWDDITYAFDDGENSKYDYVGEIEASGENDSKRLATVFQEKGQAPYVARGDGAFVNGQPLFDTLEEAKKWGQEYAELEYKYLIENDPNSGTGKFHDYQLPGGENYRELLLTLPERKAPSDWKAFQTGPQTAASSGYGSYEVHDAQGKVIWQGAANSDARALWLAARENGHENYKSGHWEENNVLAHIRFNERKDVTGKPLVFVEEIQSDWHQSGRKEGYKKPPSPAANALKEKHLARLRAIGEEANKHLDPLHRFGTPEEQAAAINRYENAKAALSHGHPRSAEWEKLGNELTAAQAALKDIVPGWGRSASEGDYTQVEPGDLPGILARNVEMGILPENFKPLADEAERIKTELHFIQEGERKNAAGVPDAPFKNSWPELALRRVLKWAADHDFPRVAWTTGDQQAERYDLSKQISKISWQPDDYSEYEGQGTLYAYDHSGKAVVEQRRLEPNEIADYIGKEPAEKLLREIKSKKYDREQWTIQAHPEADNGYAISDPNGEWLHEWHGTDVQYFPTEKEAQAHIDEEIVGHDSERDPTISGLDLKVGGEGMKSFYDKILVDAANKLGKKFGARVTTTRIRTGTDSVFDVERKNPTTGEWQRMRGFDKHNDATHEAVRLFAKTGDVYRVTEIPGEPVHVLDITPGLKEHAQSGMPLFSPDVEEESKKPSLEAPPFYSQLAKTVGEKFTGSSMPAAQLAAILRNPQNGVKADELKWTGLDDYLKGKSRVTKQEITDYLAHNNVDVKETVKGPRPEYLAAKKASDDFRKQVAAKYGDTWYYTPAFLHGPDNRTLHHLDNVFENEQRAGRSTTKFHNYQLPGGENYRELLFTLPTGKTFDEIAREIGYPNGWTSEVSTEDQKRVAAIFDAQRFHPGNTYTHAHWDEHNVLAHARFNERKDANGKPTLFVEEIQSDMHQEGRKKGYQGDEIRELPPGYSVVQSRGPNPSWMIKEGDRTVASSPDWKEKEDAIREFLRNPFFREARGEVGKVPDAPFKNTWHEMVFRRLVRWAAEHGFNSLTWTTGEQQADRYDLAKHIDSIHYTKKPGGKYAFQVTKDGKNLDQFERGSASLDDIEKLVGKDIAKRIEKGEGEEDAYPSTKDFRERGKPVEVFQNPGGGWYIRYEDGQEMGVWVSKQDAERDAEQTNEMLAEDPRKRLTGDNLKVGGAGMKGFYDKILVDYANKFGKKFGAQVQDRYLTPQGDAKTLANDNAGSAAAIGAAPVHALPITPEMRQTVVAAGLPRFSPDVRGEYWINDNGVEFADGDVGDMNHEGFAIQHAASRILDLFHADSSEEFYDEDTLRDAIISALNEDGIEADKTDWVKRAEEYIKANVPPAEHARVLDEFETARGQGDARDTAVKHWGWVWVRGNDASTWTLTRDDMHNIAEGYREILDQEGHDGPEADETEISIHVASTGKRVHMTLAELESGRTPSVDPTWPGQIRPNHSPAPDEGWPENFPKLIQQTTIQRMKAQPDYKAAKAGNSVAAVRVAKALMQPDKFTDLQKKYPDAKLVPVHAEEAGGRNKLPVALAKVLSRRFGWDAALDIVQSSRAHHTGADAVARLLRVPQFDGKVEPGREYILVDDVVTSGSTLGALRRYIAQNGGKVVAAASFGASGSAQTGHGSDLALKPETLNLLKRKFDLTALAALLSKYGVANKIRQLTNSQGRYLAAFGSLDSLRDRIAAAGLEAGVGGHGQGTGPAGGSGSPTTAKRAPAQAELKL